MRHRTSLRCKGDVIPARQAVRTLRGAPQELPGAHPRTMTDMLLQRNHCTEEPLKKLNSSITRGCFLVEQRI